MNMTYLTALSLLVGIHAFGAEERNLEALQQEFLSWKFGMFIHYNMATYVQAGWATGKEDPLLFNPTNLDIGQWADVAKSAKMKYGVLTVKHTGGWCLWDSAYTDHDIALFKNYKDGKGDIVREFVDAFRSRDLKVGLYYCFPLWHPEWREYMTLPAEGFEDSTLDALSFIKNQFTELLTNYGPIDLIWIDQSTTIHGGFKPGDWEKFREHVHTLQPNCLVFANVATDLTHSDMIGYEYPWSQELPPENNTLPTELCDKLQKGWFSLTPVGVDPDPVRDLDYIVNKMLLPSNANNCNYLLNCSPNSDGVMPDSVVKLLKEVGEAWDPSETPQVKRIDHLITELPNNQNMVAMTFDDGTENRFPTEVLPLLDAYGAKATFFVHGKTVEASATDLEKADRSGHEIGNMAMDHVNLSTLQARDLSKHIRDAEKAIHRTIQKNPQLFRSSNAQYCKKLKDILNYLDATMVERSLTVTEAELDLVLSQVKSGSIIHFSGTTAQLETLLKELKSKKLNCVTVSELGRNCSDPVLRKNFSREKASVQTGAR